MSFSRTRPNENRLPEFKELPDGRKRLTRFFDQAQPLNLVDSLVDPWGTLDVGPAENTTAGFAGLRLVDQYLQSDELRRESVKSVYVKIYEEIPATAEQQVGNPSVTINQHGYKEVTYEWIQFSAGAAVLQDPGVTAAPAPFAVCILRDQEAKDDGALRRIKRVYVEGGYLSQTEELKFGAKLKLRTLEYLNEEPPTPTGFTLVLRSIKFVNGLPIYSYGYASGTAAGGGGGEAGRSVRYSQSINQGVTGVTVTTIRTITDLTVTANPTLDPPVGATLISLDRDDEGGFRVWTAIYASGTGLVIDDKDTRNGGKLILYHRVALGTAPTTPTATIGGTVNIIGDNSRAQDGYMLHDRTYAEGEGVVSTQLDSALDGRITYETIRAYGSAVAATGQFETSTQEDDGYTVYISRGITINDPDLPDEVSTRNNGALVITRKRKINAAPTGTGEIILESADPGEGYTMYTRAYAVGEGLVSTQFNDALDGRITYETKRAYGTPVAAANEFETSTQEDDGYTVYISRGITINDADLPDEVSTRNNGALVFTTKRKINAEPTGSGIEVESSGDPRDGYTLYTKRFAVTTSGQTSLEKIGQPDGAIDWVVTILDPAAVTPANPSTGYLIRLDQQLRDGFYENRAVYRKPPVTITLRHQLSWKKPGTVLVDSPDPDFTFVGEIDLEPLASTEISYNTAQVTTTPFSVSQWAAFRETYTTIGTDRIPPQLVVHQVALNGILCSNITGSGIQAAPTDPPVVYRGIPCSQYSFGILSSVPDTVPSGDIVVGVSNQPYLTAIDGTVVYRRLVTTVNV